MKPTAPLKKFLIAGMLASCFFLVNCAGKGNDDSKAEILKQLALNLELPKCSDDTLELLTQRSTLFSSVRELLTSNPDNDQKEKLQTYISQVYAKSKSIVTNIRSSKVNGLPATGCSSKNVAKDGTETEMKYQLGIIKTEDLLLAKKVSAANDNKPNEITDSERPVWNEQDRLDISPELANFLSDERFVNGKRIITNGRIAAGGQDFLILKRNTSASLCFSTAVDGQEVDELGAQATIGNISEPRLDNLNRINIDLTLFITASYGGNRIFSLTCILADSSDLNDAVVDTFGNLLKKKTQVASPESAPKPSENVPPADQKLTVRPEAAPAAPVTPAPAPALETPAKPKVAQ